MAFIELRRERERGSVCLCGECVCVCQTFPLQDTKVVEESPPLWRNMWFSKSVLFSFNRGTVSALGTNIYRDSACVSCKVVHVTVVQISR